MSHAALAAGRVDFAGLRSNVETSVDGLEAFFGGVIIEASGL